MKNRKNTMPVLPWRRRAQAHRDASLQRTMEALQAELQATREAISPNAKWEPIEVRVALPH